MLHPSYAELIKSINSDAENDDATVNSRYSIVLATAKRARQLIDGKKPLSRPAIDKPLSIAVDELSKGLIRIEPETRTEEELEIDEMEQEIEVSEEETPEEEAPAEDTAEAKEEA